MMWIFFCNYKMIYAYGLQFRKYIQIIKKKKSSRFSTPRGCCHLYFNILFNKYFLVPPMYQAGPVLGTWNTAANEAKIPVSWSLYSTSRRQTIKIVVTVQSPSHVWFFATPWTVTCQASLSFIIFWSLLKLLSIESVMLSTQLVPCHPLLLLPSIFPSNKFAWIQVLWIKQDNKTEQWFSNGKCISIPWTVC